NIGDIERLPLDGTRFATSRRRTGVWRCRRYGFHRPKESRRALQASKRERLPPPIPRQTPRTTRREAVRRTIAKPHDRKLQRLSRHAHCETPQGWICFFGEAS